jgi:group I intron endonuclease
MQIYQILNKITGKSYVGKSKNYQNRFLNHKKAAQNKCNRRLYDSMNYHGIENFELILLEDLGNVTRQEANDKETFWVSKLNTLVPDGYNMTPGGDGGNTLEFWRDVDKQKLWEQQAKSRTGVKKTESAKRKMSIAASIREANKTTDEKRIIAEKISNTNKEKGISPPEYTKWKKGQVGAFTGKKHTAETSRKISVARQGKTYEELYGEEIAKVEKAKRSNNWKGNKNPRYVEFSLEQKQQVIDILQTKKMKMYEIVDLLKLRKFREWLREINVTNYQVMYNTLTDDQWCLFWKNVKL